jgi:FKBP-type peptidyl-prolyl cis-trans isomerase
MHRPLQLSAVLLSLVLAAPLVAQAPQAPQIPADTEILTTESGLKYSVLARGAEGAEKPKRGDRVRVHYSGWTTDGKLFDSSRQRGEPAEFGVGHVIEGWNEGLALMGVGDKFKLTIPPDLGYGDEGAAPDIPPGATLIFEVELLAITARTLPHLAWPGDGAAGVESAEGGLKYQVLEPGQGRAAASGRVMVVEFGFWTDEGKVLQSDALNGRPLLLDPANIPLPFIKNLLPQLNGGAHLLLRTPTADLAGLGFDDYEHVVGQLRVVAVMDWVKPEFSLPPDEELTTTASGLKYKILRQGGQFRPTIRSTVSAHYAGWLTNGTQFDASYDRNAPLTGPLAGLVDGWQEGMQLVGRGGMILLVVPPSLGYGDRVKAKIPAGSTLVFVVEMIEFR